MVYWAFGSYEYPQSVVTLAPTELSSKLRLADAPGVDGGYTQGGKRGIRSLTLSGTLIAEGADDIRDLWDDFLAAHAPGLPQALYVGRDDRYLLAEVASVKEPDNLVGAVDWEVGFSCADPFWYAADPTTDTVVGGSDTLTTAGNARTWPTITVELSAAGTTGTLALTCGGKTLTLACSATYLTMVVDMKRGLVTNGAGVDITHLATGKFWDLAPGANAVTRVLAGAVAPTVTSISATWSDRWH